MSTLRCGASWAQSTRIWPPAAWFSRQAADRIEIPGHVAGSRNGHQRHPGPVLLQLGVEISFIQAPVRGQPDVDRLATPARADRWNGAPCRW